MAVLIIEDVDDHFKRISTFISEQAGHSIVYPESIEENRKFINSLRSWLKNEKWPEDEGKLDAYLEHDIDVIILDMWLEDALKEKSGKKVLKQIRTSLEAKHKYTPVIILTSDQLENIEDCFLSEDVVANYYLNKSLDGVVLSDQFLEHRLRTAISMLTYWKRVAFAKADLYEVIEENKQELISVIYDQYGLLTAKIDDSTEEIIIVSKILLRVIQAQIRENDPRLNVLVDKFLAGFLNEDFDELPEVKSKRDDIYQKLSEGKEELRRLLREGAEDTLKQEFMEFVKASVKDISGCKDDTPLSIAIAKLIYRSAAQTWEFLSLKA
ncbi:MAG: hypothetical protein KJ950_00830 [Proteobacteria bacterium]|nr:hypothetical protein [Pseudomonadota bacterium]